MDESINKLEENKYPVKKGEVLTLALCAFVTVCKLVRLPDIARTDAVQAVCLGKTYLFSGTFFPLNKNKYLNLLCTLRHYRNLPANSHNHIHRNYFRQSVGLRTERHI
jgi:hypothetical protein